MLSRLSERLFGASNQPRLAPGPPTRAPADVLADPTVAEAVMLTMGAPFGVPDILRPQALPRRTNVQGTLLHAGDPAYGTVIHLGQTHCAGGARSLDHLVWSMQSQRHILEALHALAPQHIFADGLDRDFTSQQNPDPEAAALRNLFRGWKPGKPMSEQQEMTLGSIGAMRVYNATCDRPVSVHKTATAELLQRTAEVAPNTAQFGDVMRQREQVVIAELTAFFAGHPGAEAVLVMGASHKLDGYCDHDSFNPAFYFKDFSALPTGRLAQARTHLDGLRDGRP
jgi:hypothetical protein